MQTHIALIASITQYNSIHARVPHFHGLQTVILSIASENEILWLQFGYENQFRSLEVERNVQLFNWMINRG